MPLSYRVEYIYKHVLTCYVPYGVMIASWQEQQYNLLFHNICWRLFYETDFHLMMAQKYSLVKGRNALVSGYPKFDSFSIYKASKRSDKRIIWAPHYSVETGALINYSTFHL